MMVMSPTTHTVMVSPIAKLNAVKQTSRDKHLYTPEDSRSPQTWLNLTDLLPEIIGRKISSTGRQFSEMFCNKSSWACTTLPHLIEDSINVVCSHYCTFPPL